uniref:ribosomal protein S3 n=1 Tax=Hypnea marchantiae TaxID=3024792 RepID=UPI0030019ED5|nr:ribosomal protein S3 [Hypnea marchantiae]
MAQKINPTSLRLGITQLWTFNVQFYGKSFKSYFLSLHKYLKLFLFLKKISDLTGFIINYQQLKIKSQKIVLLKIYYTESFSILNKNFFQFHLKIRDLLKKVFLKKVRISYYLIDFPFISKNLLYSYSKFCASENQIVKKVLWNLYRFLEVHLNSSKVVYTPKGIKILKLKGFKIRISGRIDDSKNQMAKSLNLKIGNSCLTSLSDYIVYSASELYSKSGTCGIKIWLFYEFIY